MSQRDASTAATTEQLEAADDLTAFYLAEIERLRTALEAFANPQHWGVTRDAGQPIPVWIGTYRKSPVDLAREALNG